MRRLIPLLVGCGFIVLLASPHTEAQKAKEKGKYDPPGNLQPSDDVLKQIADKTAQLAAKVAELRKDKKHHKLLPDVEIFLRGAENIVRFKEFYNKDSGKWTLDCLDRGLERADQLARRETPWTELATRNVVRGYRSSVDGTAQPYAITYPLRFGSFEGMPRKWRVDIVLHGRGATLTEVSFMNTHNGKKKPPADQDWIQIDIYGRGNNAYRWAGETDVLEAVEAFFANDGKGLDSPDRRRVVLRGFSMGGAGTWHLGLHHPDKWCVMGPGAGFTTTHDYAWKGKKDLPDYQEKCLRIYDAIDYVENARRIPIVAYSGGDDPQKLAADNIENRLKELKIDAMTHIVAPGLGHTFPSEWFNKANLLWSEHANKPPGTFPKKLSFVTYTTKYHGDFWISINRLEKHYEKSSIEWDLIEKDMMNTDLRINTKNVRSFSVVQNSRTYTVVIDGQELRMNEKERPLIAHYVKESSKWRLLDSNEARKQNANQEKRPNLQGPIDDAFAHSFVCVIGSGDTFHPSTQKFVDAKVAAFKYDWGKHWRGELPTIGDYAVTPNEIQNKNLILFGDPQSNLTLAQILPKLPLKWTKDEIEFAGKKYKASEHVPVMIFPNPLNPNKYVVLNTGHTIPSADYTKTNALLYPRLGDYAILRLADGGVATAGLFDDYWRVEKK